MRFYNATLFLFPKSYRLRIFAICFVGTHLPLISFIIWQVIQGEAQWAETILLTVSTLIGTAAAILALQWLLHPIVVATDALGELEARRTVPALPRGGDDLIGQLLSRVNSAAQSTNSLINSLDDAAHHDVLTGLCNRRGFLERAAIMIDRHRRISVALIDLDHFKQLNDQSGHDEGDRVLREFATLVQAGVRKNDVVARWGGEEFAILFPDQSESDALRILERIRGRMHSEPLALLKDEPVTFSGGISSVQPADTGTDAALARADKALYAAKRGGRNRVQLSDTKGE